MKIPILLTLAGVTLFVGCGSKTETSSENNSGGTVLSAPTDYLKAAADSKKSAVKTVDTMALNNAIQLFGGEQGRYPKDLNELVSKKYLPEIPQPPPGMQIQYDAANGEVKIVKQ